jgi:hypothetical protein
MNKNNINLNSRNESIIAQITILDRKLIKKVGILAKMINMFALIIHMKNSSAQREREAKLEHSISSPNSFTSMSKNGCFTKYNSRNQKTDNCQYVRSLNSKFLIEILYNVSDLEFSLKQCTLNPQLFGMLRSLTKISMNMLNCLKVIEPKISTDGEKGKLMIRAVQECLISGSSHQQ